jgi:hypothetical protein
MESMQGVNDSILTCDGFSSVDDCQCCQRISSKRAFLESGELVVRRTLFHMLVPQILPQLPEDITKAKRSSQVERINLEPEPRKRELRAAGHTGIEKQRAGDS